MTPKRSAATVNDHDPGDRPSDEDRAADGEDAAEEAVGPLAQLTGFATARPPWVVRREYRHLTFCLRLDLIVRFVSSPMECLIVRGHGSPDGCTGNTAAPDKGRQPRKEAHDHGQGTGDYQKRQKLIHETSLCPTAA